MIRASRWTHRWLKAIEDLVYPPCCVVCDVDLPAVEGSLGLCEACRAKLSPPPVPLCDRCAATVGPFSDTSQGCGRCRSHRLHFDSVVRLGVYEGFLREVCLRMKQSRQQPLARALAELLWQQQHWRLEAADPRVVVPIPVHWSRRTWRGHNPAETLARRLAARLHRPCLPLMLNRCRAGELQSHLAPSRRWENVRGAFRLRPIVDVRGARVLVVDDVLTTGATSSEAARVLKAAGAAQVIVAVIARGVGVT